jgi:hypothetical protein
VSVNEFQRHQVFQWFEEAMGPERAAIIMDLLPPVGWGDIATRTDLALVRADIDVLRADLRAEIKAGNAELLYKLWFGLVASQATLVGLVLAAVKLT